MKTENHQIDEGIKDLAMTLLAALTTGAGLKYSVDQFKASKEPTEIKIKAVETAKQLSNNTEFDNAMDEILKQYVPTIQPKPEPILVKPLKRYETFSEPSIREFSNFIIPSEIYGSSINSPENKKFLKPYKDDVGLWTIGIGHLIGKGSYADMVKFVNKNGNSISIDAVLNLFDKDVEKHITLARRKFDNQWDTFSPELKKALVDISFRGDLLKPNSKDDFTFIKQIKRGDFANAAKSYLVHKEYKRRVSEGGKDGVVKRMNRNSKIIADESLKNKKSRTL
jgi:GH24 family phage-related lysozyme (muramidase)